MTTIEEKVQAVVSALEDIKATNITVLETSKLSPLFERIVIASGNSPRQTRALADNVVKQLRQRDIPVLSTEGEDGGEWVLVDLGEVVVHIMQPAVRAYYNLEELWNIKHLPRSAAHEPK